MAIFTPEMAGWLPAVIFPSAALFQLLKVLPRHSTDGVSAVSWFLFGIANRGLYIYAEKYFALQAIMGFLGTAILDFVIVALIVSKSKGGRAAAA
jgi:hypothetical protein